MLIGVMTPQDRTRPILAKTKKSSVFIIVLFKVIYDVSVQHSSKVQGEELKRIISSEIRATFIRPWTISSSAYSARVKWYTRRIPLGGGGTTAALPIVGP